MRTIIRAFSLTYREITSKFLWVVVVWGPLFILVWGSGLFEKDPFESTFGCKDPCVVRDHPGGYILRFTALANLVHRGERSLIVIDGRCASGCALLADLARPKVCITPWAELHFHQGTILAGLWNRPFVPPQSKDVLALVEKRGGFPLEGYVIISAAEAQHLWPRCNRKVPLPPKDPRRRPTR